MSFLSAFSVPAPGADELPRYRVELLVLHHLGSTAEARAEPVFRDFSEALDFLASTPEADDDPSSPQADGAPNEDPDGAYSPEPAAGCLAENVDPEPGEESQSADPDHAPPDAEALTGGLQEEELPAPPAYAADPGETMQEAWRRLRLSADFRPELYFSWHQPDVEPFPRIRVHDEGLLYVDDPWAAQRLALAEAAEAEAALEAEGADVDGTVAVETVSPDTLPADGPPGAGDATDPCLPPDQDALAEEAPEAALPDPRRFYRIDGTARLRRSRFIHLELDLEWREPVFAAAPALAVAAPDAPGDAEDGSAGTELPGAPPESVRVYRLQQSRQVRTDQVEYFDGPFFGVLAVITEIQEPAGETVTPPDAP